MRRNRSRGGFTGFYPVPNPISAARWDAQPGAEARPATAAQAGAEAQTAAPGSEAQAGAEAQPGAEAKPSAEAKPGAEEVPGAEEMPGAAARPGAGEQATLSAAGTTAELPFRIRIARSQAELDRCLAHRAETFGRHNPELLTRLLGPEPEDLSRSAAVFYAERKGGREIDGTMRILTNLEGPLPLESDELFPPLWRQHGIALAERLGVVRGALGTTAKVALFKAAYLYCMAHQIRWIISRVTPPRDLDYLRLGFRRFMEGAVSPSPFGEAPNQVHLALDLHEAAWRYQTANHAFGPFLYRRHPDIRIFDPPAAEWVRLEPPHRLSGSAPLPSGDPRPAETRPRVADSLRPREGQRSE